MVDARAKDADGVTGDLATLEWTRDRFASLLRPLDLTTVNASLVSLREDVIDTDLASAEKDASDLLSTFAGIELAS